MKKIKKLVAMVMLVGGIVGGALVMTGCDALDKVEASIDSASSAIDQLERIEEKATDIFDE